MREVEHGPATIPVRKVESDVLSHPVLGRLGPLECRKGGRLDQINGFCFREHHNRVRMVPNLLYQPKPGIFRPPVMASIIGGGPQV